ncbi:hypothetical protein GH714_003044 [Hevea brasiliensis]|uniref:3'-5' exonuclease domain-containing protein n=1 Tax=Hevea brasiliensis TaxID=3981 RepID=A0A6A6N859_HEVBR|nr:hypothetical protein GH714_003044 [Hevea brasiliensis]
MFIKSLLSRTVPSADAFHGQLQVASNWRQFKATRVFSNEDVIEYSKPGAVYVSQSLHFKSPVYIGEEVLGEVQAISIRENKKRYIAKFATKCFKKGDLLIIDGPSSIHDIQYYGDHIFTTVTAAAVVVDEWIANTMHIHEHDIPPSLIQFLGNKKFKFVGKGVWNDACKLFEDYELLVAHTKDVGYLAAKKYHDRDYRKLGLKALVLDLLQKVIPKPREITMSEWNAKELTIEQIEYACLMLLCP